MGWEEWYDMKLGKTGFDDKAMGSGSVSLFDNNLDHLLDRMVYEPVPNVGEQVTAAVVGTTAVAGLGCLAAGVARYLLLAGTAVADSVSAGATAVIEKLAA